MVKFYLISIIGNIATYEYYPDGDKSKGSGIITLDTVSGEINLVKKAEDDWSHIISAENMNDMQETINKMREENGEKHLSENEFPVATEDELYLYYASHAMDRIEEYFEKGEVPESGMVVWY